MHWPSALIRIAAPRQPGFAARFWNGLLAALLIIGLFYFAFSQVDYRWNWAGTAKYWRMYVSGWYTTVLLASSSMVLSSLIGLGTALAGRSRILVLRYLARSYVELIRGTPLLVQILIFFYVIADAFGVQNRYVAGVLVLSIFSGAYMSEIIRAGIESVGKSQWDTARAVGFTIPQIYRYVIFPQALRQALPPLAGQFASLIKDSSLLSIIAIAELTQNAKQVNAYTVSTMESYLPLAVGYLILTLPISIWTRRMEAKRRYET